MATDKKISALVESQVPGYLLEEGPNLVAFLKAYYEWMETTGQAVDASKNFLQNRDIDTTDLQKFYEYFKREVLVHFPDNILADKRLVAKKIQDLYRSKGTAAAYNLLFRILYDQNVSIYKPSENILRASDGRWFQHTTIRLGAPFSGDFDQAAGQFVTGVNSGARGKISKVFTIFNSGVEVKQLRLIEVSGTFVELEQVTNNNGLSGFVVNSVGPLSEVTFGTASSQGGVGHQVGDTVAFSSATGLGGTGVVDATTNEVVTFRIVNGGSGYRVGNTVATVSGGQPNGGLTGSVTVTAVDNPETIFIYTDKIQALSNTAIGYGPTYSSNSGVVSSNLASSNSSTALSAALGVISTQVGRISSISFEGGNYANNTLPTVSTIDQGISILDLSDGAGGFKGRNAIIQAAFRPGSITDVTVTNGGRLFNAVDPVTVTNTTREGTSPATGDPIVTGIIVEAGSYKDTRGFLSWDQRLQDNYYYQEFSYVVRSPSALKTYKNIVRDLIHPAGTKMFGRVDLNTEIDVSSFDVERLVTTDLIGGKYGIPSIESFATLSNDHQVLLEMNIPSIASNTIVSSPQVYLPAAGFIYVAANSNIILPYLPRTITEYLDDPVLIGTPSIVQGDGATDFTTFLSTGTTIEIEDRIPGTSGNTTYIVQRVFSNTVFTIDPEFVGGSMANGIFRYTYDGNI